MLYDHQRYLVLFRNISDYYFVVKFLNSQILILCLMLLCHGKGLQGHFTKMMSGELLCSFHWLSVCEQNLILME